MVRNKGVSVIVCCYNSSERIAPTLEHLFNQVFSTNISWEIILVDNNSSDDTASKAIEIHRDSGSNVSFTVISEPQPGLSYARQAGFAASKHEIALMVDDDNWLSPNYIEGVWNSFNSNESLGMVGGLGIPELEAPKPEWFERYAYCYATGPQTKNRLSGPTSELYGAGLALRLSVLEKLRSHGFSSLLSDRAGANLISGGDTELCFAFRMAGYKLWYNSEISFQHELPRSRINWKYLRKLFKGFGVSKVGIDIYASCLNHEARPVDGKFPFWFNRTIYLGKNLIKDSSILFRSTFCEIAGNDRLLAALAKLGHIQGLYAKRKSLLDEYAKVYQLRENLSK